MFSLDQNIEGRGSSSFVVNNFVFCVFEKFCICKYELYIENVYIYSLWCFNWIFTVHQKGEFHVLFLCMMLKIKSIQLNSISIQVRAIYRGIWFIMWMWNYVDSIGGYYHQWITGIKLDLREDDAENRDNKQNSIGTHPTPSLGNCRLEKMSNHHTERRCCAVASQADGAWRSLALVHTQMAEEVDSSSANLIADSACKISQSLDASLTLPLCNSLLSLPPFLCHSFHSLPFLRYYSILAYWAPGWVISSLVFPCSGVNGWLF